MQRDRSVPQLRFCYRFITTLYISFLVYCLPLFYFLPKKCDFLF